MVIAIFAVAVFFSLFLAGFIDLSKLNEKEERELSSFGHDLLTKERLLTVLDKSEISIRSYQRIKEAIEKELPRKRFQDSYVRMMDGNYKLQDIWDMD